MLDLLQKQTSEQQRFLQLQEELEKIRACVDTLVKEKDEEIVKSTTLKQWIDELKDRFMIELTVLSDHNVRS